MNDSAESAIAYQETHGLARFQSAQVYYWMLDFQNGEPRVLPKKWLRAQNVVTRTLSNRPSQTALAGA